MPTHTTPVDALQALRGRRYLLSAWPWRSLGFVLSTAVIAAPVAGAIWTLSLPWLVAWKDVRNGVLPGVVTVILMALAAGLLALVGPLVAIPAAAFERRRLALVDLRPVRTAHRPAPADPVGWLRVRYLEAATWRELLYLCFLALVIPAGYGATALLALLDAGFILSPLIASQGGDPFVLGTYQVTSLGESVPLAILGVLLLPGLLYLIGLIAGTQAAVARGLLSRAGDSAQELREVQQSRSRLVDAFEQERRRIERDLHDGAQHRLTSLTLQLGMARLDLPDDSPASQPVASAHEQAKELMVVLRELIHGIRPQPLADLGLLPALHELAGRALLPVTVTGSVPDARPPGPVESTAYFVACEALGNVVKHAGATRAEIRVSQAGDLLVLEVVDDGRGGADPNGGTGLTGLADRAAAVGGRLQLGGGPAGGTLIRVELPCSG